MKVGDAWFSQIRIGDHGRPKKFIGSSRHEESRRAQHREFRRPDRCGLRRPGAGGNRRGRRAAGGSQAAAEIPAPAPLRRGAAAVPAPAPAHVAAPPAGDAAPAPAPAPVAGAVPPAAPAPAPAAHEYAASGFTGRRLSLDFKDAEVNDILRLISEVSGLNFVSGPR